MSDPLFKFTNNTNKVVFRVFPGGMCESHSVDAVEYQKWLAAGNLPLPADPDPTPIDLSDVDNLEKSIKTLALCIAQVGGLTVPQMKALFKSKWESLP